MTAPLSARSRLPSNRKSRAVLRITNADRLPWLDVEGNATRSKTSADFLSAPGIERTATIYTVQGAASFELDLWGRLQRASESARAQLLNSEYGREATKLGM